MDWCAWLRNLLYPAICPSCENLGSHQAVFCPRCAGELRTLGKPYCSVCGLPLAGEANRGARCGSCIRRPPAFDRARAAFVYGQADHGSPLARAIARFKYGRVVSLAQPLGHLLRYACPIDPFAYDWVVPVPLTMDRLRWRGFNQALLLARALAPRDRIAPLLERSKATRPQAELSREERLTNVRGAFRVRHEMARNLRGASILLVDDVMTTGATVHECSAALSQAGAKAIDVLVLARATVG